MSQQQQNIRESIIKGLRHISGSEVTFKEQIEKVVTLSDDPDSTQFITAFLELFNKIQDGERDPAKAYIEVDSARQRITRALKEKEGAREISNANAIEEATSIMPKYNRINAEFRAGESKSNKSHINPQTADFKILAERYIVEDKEKKVRDDAIFADLCVKMHKVEKLDPQAPLYEAAKVNLEETSKSFFENLRSPKQWETMEAIFNKEFPKAGKVVSDMLVQEKENIISFKMDGALAKYLQSADPKTLAKNLDRNMRDNHITLDKDFAKDKNIQKFFPKEIIEKITALGKELDNLREERSTFVGKVKQTIKNYAGMIMDAFSKLAGKKVDDRLLGGAMAEWAKKTQMIDTHLEKNVDKTQAKETKNFGKFVGQILATQPRGSSRHI